MLETNKTSFLRIFRDLKEQTSVLSDVNEMLTTNYEVSDGFTNGLVGQYVIEGDTTNVVKELKSIIGNEKVDFSFYTYDLSKDSFEATHWKDGVEISLHTDFIMGILKHFKPQNTINLMMDFFIMNDHNIISHKDKKRILSALKQHGYVEYLTPDEVEGFITLVLALNSSIDALIQ